MSEKLPKKEGGGKYTRHEVVLLLAGVAFGYSFAHRETIAWQLTELYHEAPSRVRDLFARDTYDETVRQEIDLLQSRYGCEIEFSTGMDPLSEKKKGLTMLRTALAKYPPDFLKNFKLKFTFKGPDDRLGGYASGNGNIVLNIKLPEGADPATFEDTTICHEIHHEIDAAYRCHKYLIDEWVQLNPNGQKDYVHDKWVEYAASRPQGFWLANGMQNENEDQAEIAGALFFGPKLVDEVASDDEVLAKKVKKLKEYYFQWSDGKIDDQYWIDLDNGKVNEAYWDDHQ